MRSWLKAVAAVLALGVLAPAGQAGWGWMEKKTELPVPRTAIAVFNLAAVVKQYDKATDCQNEFKEAVKAFQKREQELKEELDDLRKKLDTERLTPEKREAAEKKGRQLSRQMFELQEEARSTIAKKQERQVTEIYTDIRQAAQRYAAAHNVALVMHYNDALPDSPDFSSSQNVTRKIQAGALMPVYIAPGIDITRELIEDLNERYRHENAVEGDD